MTGIIGIAGALTPGAIEPPPPKPPSRSSIGAAAAGRAAAGAIGAPMPPSDSRSSMSSDDDAGLAGPLLPLRSSSMSMPAGRLGSGAAVEVDGASVIPPKRPADAGVLWPYIV